MDFKFGHTYIKPIKLNFDWGRMQDNQRRVFRINTEQVSENEIETYIRRIANKFKNEPIINESVGHLDHRFDRDYFIPTRERNPDIPDIPDLVIVDHISLLRT